LLGFGGLAIALLLSAVITLGSLTLPFEPRQWDLYALTVFIVAALLVFVVILTRSLLRLWSEQRAHQPGSRFKRRWFWAPSRFPSAGSVFVLRQLRLAEPHTGAVVPPSARNGNASEQGPYQ